MCQRTKHRKNNTYLIYFMAFVLLFGQNCNGFMLSLGFCIKTGYTSCMHAAYQLFGTTSNTLKYLIPNGRRGSRESGVTVLIRFGRTYDLIKEDPILK